MAFCCRAYHRWSPTWVCHLLTLSHIDIWTVESPRALVAPGCLWEASQSLVCSPQLLGGRWRAELGQRGLPIDPAGAARAPLMSQSSWVEGGGIAAGESRSWYDRSCAYRQMESRDNLILSNCLLVHFSTISELRLSSLWVLGSRIVNAANIPFLLWLAVSLGPVSAPDHRPAHFSSLFLGCRGEIGIYKCWPWRGTHERCASVPTHHPRT